MIIKLKKQKLLRKISFDFDNSLTKLSNMMNIFSVLYGFVIFSEVIFLVLLLKPVRQPYYIRNCWKQLQDKIVNPTNAFSFLIFVVAIVVTVSSFFEMEFVKQSYGELLQEVDDIDLEYKFYVSKVSLSSAGCIVVVYLLIVIHRVTELLIVIARLLEFELMCRHAILSKDINQDIAITTSVTKTYIAGVYKFNEGYVRYWNQGNDLKLRCPKNDSCMSQNLIQDFCD